MFRRKFIILFPYDTDCAIRLCKLKRELIKLRNANRPDGDLRFPDQMRFCEVKRESIDDEDFFDFEKILKRLPEKIQKRRAALKPLLNA
ncbi:MAG: hypothetical protein WA063_07515 [Minisyncoccia bacterium]